MYMNFLCKERNLLTSIKTLPKLSSELNEFGIGNVQLTQLEIISVTVNVYQNSSQKKYSLWDYRQRGNGSKVKTSVGVQKYNQEHSKDC